MYKQDYYGPGYTGGAFPAINYTSPIIHHAIITQLQPNTTYQYQVQQLSPASHLQLRLFFTCFFPHGPPAVRKSPHCSNPRREAFVYSSSAMWKLAMRTNTQMNCRRAADLDQLALTVPQVGDPATQEWSKVHQTTTQPLVGPSTFPYRVGLVADLGDTGNSSTTMDHLAASDPSIILLVSRLRAYMRGMSTRPGGSCCQMHRSPM